MFILRSVAENDLEALKRLSEIVFFINLPNDEEIIRKKIANSIESFTHPSTDLSENTYIFVMEDMTNNQIVGVSMIHAQHGTEDEPHFYLKVSQEHKYSQTINTGFVHGTLKLGLDTNGPTEIGGLVIDPQYRGHPEKLGKQLSFVRFLYMANHSKEFKDTVLSELMPPLDKQGNSPLWEAIGRRFMNMNYIEADRLSRSNKEFILSLFPSDNIYQTLLPIEARNAIGKVGDETKPVKKMLESIGFHYSNEVDPFDGGPHYKSKLKDITVVKSFHALSNAKMTTGECEDDLMLEFKHPSYSFSATRVKGKIENGVLSFQSTKNDKIDQFIITSPVINLVKIN